MKCRLMIIAINALQQLMGYLEVALAINHAAQPGAPLQYFEAGVGNRGHCARVQRLTIDTGIDVEHVAFAVLNVKLRRFLRLRLRIIEQGVFGAGIIRNGKTGIGDGDCRRIDDDINGKIPAHLAPRNRRSTSIGFSTY